MSLPTAERIRELLDYDPETGVFTRIVRRGPSIVGRTAGTVNGNGYVQIMIDGGIYPAHRLAWVHVHGSWPVHQIDHRNRNRSDNRLRNLREATNSQNQHNRNVQCNNTSGLTGVSRSGSRWKAEIDSNGRRYYLGCFGDAKEAALAYQAAKERLHQAHSQVHSTAP